MEFSPPEDPDNLLENRRIFLQFNQHKIERALKEFSETETMLFTVIPRLLHVNQEGLPGYSGDDVPCGIHQFTVDRQSQEFAERLFPEQIIRRPSSFNPAIQSLLLVGSVGSIAQNKTSDLDYTLLVDRSTISETGIERLREKLRRIEKWALDKYDQETHFFINDHREVKNNHFGESDSESTGSALAKMLKEEMYRTMILAAGKIPFWWVVPVNTDDAAYESLYDQVLRGETLLDKEDFIDIGNIADISDGEFFGGCIWTLIKSFKSPFKTLLKMGLLEDYMFNKTSFNLLCHQIKEKVFSGDHSYRADPYFMLYERVENFFQKAKSSKETDALRIAFYMKLGTRVEFKDMDKPTDDYKKSILIKKLSTWKWPASKLESLNAYTDWHMNQKVAMGKRINSILMASYEAISEKNRTLDPSETTITKTDTHLLGRKLFSYYRKAPNKVENLYSVVDGQTAQSALTFLMDSTGAIEHPAWYLVRGKTTAQISQINPDSIIKKASSLQFLIAFTAFNHLYQKNTELFIRPENLSITKANLEIILKQLNGFMGHVNITAIHNKDLLSKVRITKLYLIIDFGNPVPREIYVGDINHCRTQAELKQFISKRTDKIRNITAINLTSWGELFCKTYSGLNSMNRCMEEMSRQTVGENVSERNFLKINIPGRGREILQIPWLNKYVTRTLNSNKASLVHQEAS